MAEAATFAKAFSLASFQSQQLAQIEALMKQCIGVESIEVDGRRVTYTKLLKDWKEIRSYVARENGTRPIIAQHFLGGYR